MTKYPVVRFLIFWGVNTLSLWVADELFDGISFTTPQALFIGTQLHPEFADWLQQGQDPADPINRAGECGMDSRA